MRLIFRHLPLVALGALVVCLWIALSERDPYVFPYDSIAAQKELELPDPRVGTTAVSGRVVDAARVPLAQALVAVEQRGRLLWTYSEADGNFALSELDEGPHSFSVLAHNYVPSVIEDPCEPGQEVLLIVEPQPRQPEIEGVVWADLTGSVRDPRAPTLRDFEVVLLPTRQQDLRRGAVPRRVQLDRAGQFAVPRLAPGRYEVRLLPAWARGALTPNLLAALGASPPTYTHTIDASAPRSLQLEPVSGEIVGNIVYQRDSETGTRVEYLEGAQVIVEAGGNRSGLTLWPPTTTDATGAFTLRDLPPGDYTVRVLTGSQEREKSVTVTERATINADFAPFTDV